MAVKLNKIDVADELKLILGVIGSGLVCVLVDKPHVVKQQQTSCDERAN